MVRRKNRRLDASGTRRQRGWRRSRERADGRRPRVGPRGRGSSVAWRAKGTGAPPRPSRSRPTGHSDHVSRELLFHRSSSARDRITDPPDAPLSVRSNTDRSGSVHSQGMGCREARALLCLVRRGSEPRVAMDCCNCARSDRARVVSLEERGQPRSRAPSASTASASAHSGQLLQVAGRISEPRSARVIVSVNPPQSRPTRSTRTSGMLPMLMP
jgi:hypothetical protein